MSGAIRDIYPLTPLQQGILFHTLMAPRDGLYIDQLAVELETDGDFDLPAFAEAVGAAVGAIDVLRTAFVWEGQEGPLQLVLDHAPMTVGQLDWRSLDETEAGDKLEAFLAEERNAGFDLAKPPLMRMTAVHWSDGSWRLVTTYHHIILDAWSIVNLFAEIRKNYRVVRGPARTPPSEHRYSFKDYVLSLPARLRPDAEPFWRDALSNVSGPTSLAVKRAGSEPRGGHLCAEHVFVLSAEQTAQIRAAAKRAAVTLATLVEGAWALLLARYAGTSDVLFGITFAGRPADQPDAAAKIGLFINTLPVRVTVNASDRVGPWLRELHRQFANLRAHEFTPLPKIKEWAGLPQGVALFDSVMAFENIPGAVSKPDAARQTIDARNGRYLFRTNYPINVMVVPADEMMLRINYDTGLYDPAAIGRAMEHFASLLVGLSENEQRRLGDLPLMSRQERDEVLAAGLGPVGAYPADRCIHELFEDQATRFPDGIAVVDGVREWTYRELDERANALAWRIIEAGVGPEKRVVICAERSAELAAGVLAILKAGGVHVPLDPDYPKARLASMLQRAKPALILCEPSLLALLPESPAMIVPLERSIDGNRSGERPSRRAKPDNAAYVIFTSGSTGVPKGIELAHRGLCNMIPCWNELFDVRAGDRVLQFASFSFDASVWEIFSALISGATLCFGDRATLYSAERLLGALRELRITHALLPPSLLGVLDPDELPQLRCVAAIGERCTMDIARRWKTDRRFYNAYGPAEATITDCVHEVPDVRRSVGDPPIGHPMTNVRLYALDPDQQLVPSGVAGELHIGGVNLARGYIELAGATAEKFLPDPFSGIPGARMYRTGDLVRINDDGEFEYLGRADSQVKIRGVRVELNEVEGALRRHSAVRDAIVVARDVQAGLPEQRLIAYLIVPDVGARNVASLRSYLRGVLPEAMVPSVFVFIDRMPLTPNGKIDKKGLPDPDFSRSDAIGEFTAPRSEMERRLAGIWAKVLRLEKVGIRDNFFDLGGDSIVSIRLVAAAQRAGLTLTPRLIFENQTIDELARALAPGGGAVAAPIIRPAGPFPATPVQRWFLLHAGRNISHENLSIVLRVDPGLSESKLAAALQQLVDRHDSLRLKAEWTEGGEWRLLIRPPGAMVNLQRVRTPQRDVFEQLTRVQEQLVPERGQVFAAVLLQGEKGGDRLLMSAHHLSIDAMSWTILLDDLTALCQDQTLPDPMVPFAAWADALHGHAARGAFAGHADYWLQLLQGAPVAGADMAADAGFESELVRFTRDETDRLLAIVPATANPGDFLLLAIMAAVGGGTLVDMESMGRRLSEVPIDPSRTVGWFTAIAPFRLPARLPEELDLAMREVSQRRLEWEDHAASYGILAGRDDATARQLCSAPPRQVLFNWLGRLDRICPEDGPFELLDQEPGLLRSPDRARPYPVELNAWLIGGQLNLHWTLPAKGRQRERARMVAASVRRTLLERAEPIGAIETDLSSEELAVALASMNL
ncbi:amino acid adenylation domain-containing protein [Bradyrhizobium ontarionense]|uniref:Amino acid adenylation domain-containing protein n=1 Tax=Bradyrhizobium ontarionense TaxID=2898149 RepID=A0ABY3R7L0_9BRAD|nr:non-ribosomal peptide synthetase [Bradyrhizobium sp. A19]UFZ03309.1 amino acid adenylation domain-containing protein [Bradyrhizobium sp. A19]